MIDDLNIKIVTFEHLMKGCITRRVMAVAHNLYMSGAVHIGPLAPTGPLSCTGPRGPTGCTGTRVSGPKCFDPSLFEKNQQPSIKNPKSGQIRLPDDTLAMECIRCEKQFQWVVPNQEDETFICYGCRNGI